MRYLVAVSAPVGGGKTSLVKGLAKRLPDATAIHFDSYETLTEQPLESIRRWMLDGADIDEFVIPDLPEHLDRLKRGEPVVDPHTGATTRAAKYILFETPFARQHSATGKQIDLSLWIDTPLDVALARNLREFTRRPEMQPGFAPWLYDYLGSYLDAVREMLCLQQRTVGGAADVTLDGQNDLETNLTLAAREITTRLP